MTRGVGGTPGVGWTVEGDVTSGGAVCLNMAAEERMFNSRWTPKPITQNQSHHKRSQKIPQVPRVEVQLTIEFER